MVENVAALKHEFSIRQFSILNSIHIKEPPMHTPKRRNIVKEKSFMFALDIIKVVKWMHNEKHEYILSKQLIRSGTAIGALIREAEHAESRRDFIHKLSISLKEANETDYWIELLSQASLITSEHYDTLHPQIQELIKLLISIIKSTKFPPSS
jgi:four helix bundle protein